MKDLLTVEQVKKVLNDVEIQYKKDEFEKFKGCDNIGRNLKEDEIDDTILKLKRKGFVEKSAIEEARKVWGLYKGFENPDNIAQNAWVELIEAMHKYYEKAYAEGIEKELTKRMKLGDTIIELQDKVKRLLDEKGEPNVLHKIKTILCDEKNRAEYNLKTAMAIHESQYIKMIAFCDELLIVIKGDKK